MYVGQIFQSSGDSNVVQ